MRKLHLLSIYVYIHTCKCIYIHTWICVYIYVYVYIQSLYWQSVHARASVPAIFYGCVYTCIVWIVFKCVYTQRWCVHMVFTYASIYTHGVHMRINEISLMNKHTGCLQAGYSCVHAWCSYVYTRCTRVYTWCSCVNIHQIHLTYEKMFTYVVAGCQQRQQPKRRQHP